MSGLQRWESEFYQRDTGFVADYGADVLSWLEPVAGERILDLGCGDGVLTQKIVAAGADVVGADSSPSFVQTARASGLDARVLDAQNLPFDREFDAVFSNAALHWMIQADDVISSVKRALKPNGRFVGEFGGFGNVAAIITAMRAVGEELGGDPDRIGPWFFPTVDHYSALLEQQGFKVDNIVTFYRQTPLPTGMRAWLKVMSGPFFDQFGDGSEAALDKVEAVLKDSLCDHNGKWFADYVRLRFLARVDD
ncbi:MAG: methyltransferase domain-containing protein [Rhizobiaceae bacterium]|nr:methyltransferase domain-containing protein [Rhizobiaceae bacterium]